jgi:hypothetical protein
MLDVFATLYIVNCVCEKASCIGSTVYRETAVMAVSCWLPSCYIISILITMLRANHEYKTSLV